MLAVLARPIVPCLAAALLTAQPAGGVALPVGGATRYDVCVYDAAGAVQLLTSDAQCYEADLATVKQADGVQFKAKTP